MSLSCTITLKGDGVGRYGKSKKDRTGPMSEFLVFNHVIFKAVRDHLCSCAACDPNEVLEAYLERLRCPPTKSVDGGSSGTLLKHIAMVEKQMARAGRHVRPELANEFWLRSRDPADILARADRCSLTELVRCYQLQELRAGGYRVLQQLCGQSRTFAAIQQILKGGGAPPPEAELRELLDVAEVMLS